MKRRLLITLFSVLLIISMTSTAYASMSRATLILPSLKFDGMTAECSVAITANPNDEIRVTIQLRRGDEIIVTWTETGTGYINFNETEVVTRKGAYTLTVDAIINNEPKPQFSADDICK